MLEHLQENKYIYKFCDALILRCKNEYIWMPNEQECKDNEKKSWRKYRLKGVCIGMDVTHSKFQSAPRGLPEDKNTEDFCNRHVVYSLNLLVTAGPDHIIYDVVEKAPGHSHDAGNNERRNFELQP